MDISKFENKIRKKFLLGDIEGTIKECQEVLMVSKNYLAYVYLGACYCQKKQPILSLDFYKKALQLEPKKVAPYEGIVALFEKHWKSLMSEMVFFREFILTLQEAFLEKPERRREITEAFMAVFKEVRDAKGVFLTSSLILMNGSFEQKNPKHQHTMIFEFINSVYGANIWFENEDLNKRIEKYSDFLMRNELSDKKTKELAWKVYFKLQCKCTDTETLWKMATLRCPSPLCIFNCERVLLIYMETYPRFKNELSKNYVGSLPKKNPVLKLYESFTDAKKRRVNNILEVLNERPQLIVAYLLLAKLCFVCKYHCLGLSSTTDGIKMLKRQSAVYHIPKDKMMELFQIELYKVKKDMKEQKLFKLNFLSDKRKKKLERLYYDGEWDLQVKKSPVVNFGKTEVIKKNEKISDNEAAIRNKIKMLEGDVLKLQMGEQGDGMNQFVDYYKKDTRIFAFDKSEEKKAEERMGLTEASLNEQIKAEDKILKEKKKLEKLEQKRAKEEKKLQKAKLKEEKKVEQKEMKEKKNLEKQKLKEEKKLSKIKSKEEKELEKSKLKLDKK